MKLRSRRYTLRSWNANDTSEIIMTFPMARYRSSCVFPAPFTSIRKVMNVSNMMTLRCNCGDIDIINCDKENAQIKWRRYIASDDSMSDIRTWRAPSDVGPDLEKHPIAMSIDANIITIGIKHDICLFRGSEDGSTMRLTYHKTDIECVSLSANERRLISGRRDGVVAFHEKARESFT